MNRKIIFFDIDGTIYCTEVGRVTEAVKQCIAKAQTRGHLCFIASGRPWSFIAGNIKELQFDGYILANGAHIRYQDRDVAVRYLSYEDVKALCRKLREEHIQYILSSEHVSYIDRNYRELLDFYKNCNIDFENFIYDFDEEEVFHKTLKIEAWASVPAHIDCVRTYGGQFVTEIHGPGQTMEIYGREVSKAAGIEKVIEMLDLSKENSFCFGDGPNDVEMFGTVGHGFAMANGVDEVKAIAEDICLRVEKDGVAVKMKELFGAGVL